MFGSVIPNVVANAPLLKICKKNHWWNLGSPMITPTRSPKPHNHSQGLTNNMLGTLLIMVENFELTHQFHKLRSKLGTT